MIAAILRVTSCAVRAKATPGKERKGKHWKGRTGEEGSKRRGEKGRALGTLERRGGFSLPPQPSWCLPFLPSPGVASPVLHATSDKEYKRTELAYFDVLPTDEATRQPRG